uniref:Reverse transcriptase domain-containing protein n=1 Tax=Amphimedon queenslandica TaxID=400682 RepID=A0A1X7V2T7_AMPQE
MTTQLLSTSLRKREINARAFNQANTVHVIDGLWSNIEGNLIPTKSVYTWIHQNNTYKFINVGGCEGAVHAVRNIFDSVECEAVLFVDASNAFNSLNRNLALINIKNLCPSLSTILINCYRLEVPLSIDGEIMFSAEGTTQGDPLAMAMYAIGILPLIRLLHKYTVSQVWYADDAAALGQLNELHKWWVELTLLFPTYETLLLDTSSLRCLEAASESGASSWLTALPIKEHSFALHKGAFRDALCLRYGWTPLHLSSHCVCGSSMSIEHALNCKCGGFPSLRHNELRDITADLLTEISILVHEVHINLKYIGEFTDSRYSREENLEGSS